MAIFAIFPVLPEHMEYDVEDFVPQRVLLRNVTMCTDVLQNRCQQLEQHLQVRIRKKI